MLRAAGLPIGARKSRPILVKRCRMAEMQSPPESIEVIFSAATIAERIDGMARRIAQVGLDDLLVVAVLCFPAA